MLNMFVKFLVKFVASETMKEIVKYGASELVKRTNTGIDDELASNLLGNIKTSNRNKVKEVAVREAKRVITSGLEDIIYKIK